MHSGERTLHGGQRLTPEEVATASAVVQGTFRQYRPYLLERAGNIAHTDKEIDGSPVTEADLKIEKAAQAALKEHLPGIPVFGEETGYGDDDQKPVAFWLIDPIDGTKAFIENIPSFTGMAVLIQDGEAIASVIYNYTTDTMFTAQKDKGAYKNETKLDLGSMPLPKKALCKGRHIAALDALLAPAGVTNEIAPIGGGQGFTMVAEGLVAARFNLHSRGYTHDYAPGALLVREAGGSIIPILDDEYTYETRSFVACHPALEPVLRSQIPQLRKLELPDRQ